MTGGRRWFRLAAVAAVLGLVTLASGCAVVSGFGLIGQQERSSATSRPPFTICASGSTGCG